MKNTMHMSESVYNKVSDRRVERTSSIARSKDKIREQGIRFDKERDTWGDIQKFLRRASMSFGWEWTRNGDTGMRYASDRLTRAMQ